MEVKGAPDGPVQPLSSQWHECIQWAISECNRLEMEFGLSADFGYGNGGLHITPELSMQKLYWSETEVVGGQKVTILLPKPQVSKDFSASVRLHPGSVLREELLNQIELTDSYKDIAVIALPLPETTQARNFRIPGLNSKDGTTNNPPDMRFYEPPPKAIASLSHIVDLTGNMTAEGELEWNPPDGKWLIMRFGHASKYQLTKPGPAPVIGLECDRLAKIGIKTHYNAFLKNIFKGAGSLAGKSLNYVFIDSWEAGGQNWTASFPDEFHARRGYDIRTWLPVFAGRVLGSVEESERFLWDVRNTVSNLIRDNYFGHLHELAEAHGIKMAVEAYGHVCTDNLSAAGGIDMPVAEFWRERESELPVNPLSAYAPSSKVMSSAAHTYGKSVTGAEAFTSDDAWQDHPYILKASGDKRFCEGINRMILHCSTHQPYDNMVPGLTHHRWGGHFDRFNTWWDYAKPWMEYLTRCQFLLRQGEFVADVAYCYGEGAPLNINFMQLDIPKGYDFDFCSSEMMLQMSVKNGRIVLPSGMSYRYLKLPDTDRMTLTLVSKIKELVDAGAKVIGGVKPMGSPSLSDSFESEKKIREIAAELWDSNRVISGKTLSSVFREDQLSPDFEGGDLHYIHRRTMDADIYFISHQDETTENIICTFRISGKQPELWDPETGLIRELPEFNEYKGRISIDLHFEPKQSWFVVFRERNESSKNFTKKRIEKNFKDIQMVRELNSQCKFRLIQNGVDQLSRSFLIISQIGVLTMNRPLNTIQVRQFTAQVLNLMNRFPQKQYSLTWVLLRLSLMLSLTDRIAELHGNPRTG